MTVFNFVTVEKSCCSWSSQEIEERTGAEINKTLLKYSGQKKKKNFKLISHAYYIYIKLLV